MSRSAPRAAVATAIATTLATAATASAAPPPKALTNQYPLGTQTLSHSASTPRQSAASPAPKQTAKQTAPPTTQPSATPKRQHRSHGPSSGTRIALLALAGGIVSAILIADWIVLRKPRRRKQPPRAPLHRDPRTPRGRPLGRPYPGGPRHRRRVPRPLLWLLSPIYHHDRVRDAWVLRGIGGRHGPVLRPRGYDTDRVLGDPADDEPDITAQDLAETRPTVPDPFARPSARRVRPRKHEHPDDGREPDEPPPLVIRPSQEREAPPLPIRRRPE